jgi:hypothetical protein
VTGDTDTRHHAAPSTSPSAPHLHATSRRDAAERLGITVQSVDAMVKRGELRAFKVLSRTMIPISELERVFNTPHPRALTTTEAWQADHPTNDTTTT